MKKIIELDVYQELAMKTSKDFGSKEKQLEYAILSLCGEAGELANLLKKKVYHNKKNIEKDNFIDEASDVLWYLSCIMNALGIKLSDLATFNIEKLSKRYKDGKYTEKHYSK